MRRVGATCTAALALALVLTACGEDDGAQASGDVVHAGASADISGTDGFVQLPHGQVRFQVSAARPLDPAGLPGDEADSIDEDRDYIGVAWEFVSGEGVPVDAGGFAIADQVPARVGFAIDGDTFELGDAYPVAGSDTDFSAAYVPVDTGTTLDDATFEVSFDDVTQGVGVSDGERTGAQAAALYDPMEDAEARDCELALEPAGLEGDLGCTVAVRALPWVTDLGWAPEGESWWVVDAATTAGELRDDEGGRYAVTAMTDQSTVAGEGPAATLVEDFSASSGMLRTQQVFSAPAGDPPSVDVSRSLTWSESDAGSLAKGDEVVLAGTAD